jgi:hypothetical protein
MSEVTQWQPGPLSVLPNTTEVTYLDPTGGRLESWARSMVAAKQIADALCNTTFAPQAFRGKPNDGAAAIMFGDEIGFTPTQALRSIHVISGTPGLYAKAMVALVQSHGHEVWTEKSADDEVVVCGRRKGSDHTEKVSWTTARARKAGYTSNKKYETDPQAMLYARASSDVCRRIAADALAGVAVSVEELELEGSPRTSRRVSRTTAEVVPMPEPDLTPQTDSGAGTSHGSTAPESPLLNTSSALAKRMFAMFNEVGLSERDDRLAYVSDVIGRTVASSSEMTDDDAGAVINALQRDIDGKRQDAEAEPTFEGMSQ